MSKPDRPVSYHCDSGLGVIHFSDGQGNRLNHHSLQSLKEGLYDAVADTQAKIILLRSGEDSFCLGMDLRALELSFKAHSELVLSDSDSVHSSTLEAERHSAIRLYSELLSNIMVCAKPVIALIEGEVKAGGIGLAAACDIVIGTENASFEFSEILFGLVPFNVLPYVFELRMSPQRFRYLVLSASRLEASAAKDVGLLDQIYSSGELEKKLRSFFRVMMRAEPNALAVAKTQLALTIGDSFDQRRKRAEESLLNLMSQPQVQEGLSAFNAGHTPPWFQRFRPLMRLSGHEDSAQDEELDK